MGNARGIAPDSSDHRHALLVVAGGSAASALGIILGLLPLQFIAAGAATAGALAFAATSPSWAVGVVLMTLPLELMTLPLGPVGLSPVQVAMLFVAALVAASALARGKHVVPRTPLDAAILAWVGINFLGAIEALDPAAAIKKAGMTVFLAGIYYATVSSVRTVDKSRRIFWILVLACSIIGAYGIWVSYQYVASGAVTKGAMIVHSEGLKSPRAGSTFGNPSALAAMMTLVIPIAIVLVATVDWKKKFFAAGCLVILFVGLGFTFTRGAWLGTALGLVVLMLDRRFHPTLLVVVLVLALTAPGPVLSRVGQSTQLERGEISSRFDFWKASLLITEKRPILGVGTNNFPLSFSRLPVPETANRTAIHAHNVLLTVLAENGALGLVVFLLLLGTTFSVALRRRRDSTDPIASLYRLAIVAGLVAYFGHQMTDSMLLEPSLNAVMWILIGIAVGLADEYGPAGATEQRGGKPSLVVRETA